MADDSEDLLHLHLPDEFFLALGRVTAHFTALEGQLKHLATLLVSEADQELGQILTAEMSFRGIVTLVSALSLHGLKDRALRTKIESLLTRAAAVEDRRNRVIHSEWWPGESDEVRIRWKTTARKGKGLVHTTEVMRASDIEEIAVEASAVAAGIGKIATAWANRSLPRNRR